MLLYFACTLLCLQVLIDRTKIGAAVVVVVVVVVVVDEDEELLLELLEEELELDEEAEEG